MSTIKAAKVRNKKIFTGIALSSPVLLFLFIFVFISIAYCLYMSLFEWKIFDLGENRLFVALDNYIRIFQDKIFGTALLNTLGITTICLTIETVLGFFIALTLWTIGKNFRLTQTTMMLPMITAPVIVGLIWRYIYDPQFGMLNFFLTDILNKDPVAWLANEKTAIWSVMIVDIWQMTPFTILILFASMMGITKDLIEAAEVDGARYWKIVQKIIIPSILPMILFVVMMRIMDLVKIFDTIYVLTRGGPLYATETLAIYTYKVGFTQSEMGYSMALSITTLIIICTIVALINIIRRKVIVR